MSIKFGRGTPIPAAPASCLCSCSSRAAYELGSHHSMLMSVRRRHTVEELPSTSPPPPPQTPTPPSASMRCTSRSGGEASAKRCAGTGMLLDNVLKSMPHRIPNPRNPRLRPVSSNSPSTQNSCLPCRTLPAGAGRHEPVGAARHFPHAAGCQRLRQVNAAAGAGRALQARGRQSAWCGAVATAPASGAAALQLISSILACILTARR